MQLIDAINLYTMFSLYYSSLSPPLFLYFLIRFLHDNHGSAIPKKHTLYSWYNPTVEAGDTLRAHYVAGTRRC